MDNNGGIIYNLERSTMLSVEKDTEKILEALFIKSKPYSDVLKSLLIIPRNDCLSEMGKYKSIIDSYSLPKLRQEGYIRIVPKLKQNFNSNKSCCLVITYNNFFKNNTNPHYRDHYINFYCICSLDTWELDDYQLRPMKMVGYIDSILMSLRLSGIGKVDFAGCSELILNEEQGGYVLSFLVYNGNDDRVK